MTIIFDIGKTNKKAFLFDEDYQEVFKKYSRFDELQDADGFPCDDLLSIESWVKKTAQEWVEKYGKQIEAINFSTYGASFVHIDESGKPLTPLFNYLKPYPKKLLDSFYNKYGEALLFAKDTASPPMGMLNSGLQLYWLKYEHPEIFQKIKWSLHFPQYLSFLLTGKPVSEFTSIGCHTGLWNFSKNDYHQWVYNENITEKLPPIVAADSSINTSVYGTRLKVGVGIHDSSSALLPYIRVDKKPFLLISTGTWSIALNPFNHQELTDTELEQDCLSFMRTDGKPVRAARLFLGQEYKTQLKEIVAYFKVDKDAHRAIRFNEEVFAKCKKGNRGFFAFDYLTTTWEQPQTSRINDLDNFEVAYHQLMWELVQLQIESAKLAIGETPIRKIYIDGGFADNEVYFNMLAHHFSTLKLRKTQSPLGSALGAALVISEKAIGKKFLKKNYALKKFKRAKSIISNG